MTAAVQADLIPTTAHADVSLDQYTDLLYSSSSPSSGTPQSNDLVPAVSNPAEQQAIWNIFDQITSQMNAESLQHEHHALHFHPYKSFGSIQSHTSSLYSSYLAPCRYSSLRSCHIDRRVRRRKCYGCRRQGHLRKECPYLPHE